jgi:hypothetical protein
LARLVRLVLRALLLLLLGRLDPLVLRGLQEPHLRSLGLQDPRDQQALREIRVRLVLLALLVLQVHRVILDQPDQQDQLALLGVKALQVQPVQLVLLAPLDLPVLRVRHLPLQAQRGRLEPLVIRALPDLPGLLVQPAHKALRVLQGQLALPVRLVRLGRRVTAIRPLAPQACCLAMGAKA